MLVGVLYVAFLIRSFFEKLLTSIFIASQSGYYHDGSSLLSKDYTDEETTRMKTNSKFGADNVDFAKYCNTPLIRDGVFSTCVRV